MIYFEVSVVILVAASHFAVSPNFVARYAAGRYATPLYTKLSSSNGSPFKIYFVAPNVALIVFVSGAPVAVELPELSGGFAPVEVSVVIFVVASQRAVKPNCVARYAAGRYATPL